MLPLTKRIAFVTDEFVVGKPVQQLLDRFLIGYPHDGLFRKAKAPRINLYSSIGSAEIERRAKGFGLVQSANLHDCVADATEIVIAESGLIPSSRTVRSVLEAATKWAPIFVYGALTSKTTNASAIFASKESLQRVISGTTLATTFWLPQLEIPGNLQRAAVIVQGPYPAAEVEGLDILFTITGQENQRRYARRLEGDLMWQHLEWEFGPLIASALCRSDSPQGDAVIDARTQDLFGRGLVRKLAKDPRAWLIEREDGFRSILAVLDGVVADYHFAVQTTRGKILSAQLYRPPGPARHEFSRLASVIEEFFRTGVKPWPTERALVIAQLLERFEREVQSFE